MITVSLCMIVRNEEKVLGRCLDCVKELVDEIIIVDTGSRDRTCEIASEYTDKIYDYSWQEDFSSARNFSLEKGTMEYLMWLDADDVITEVNQEKFLRLKSQITPDTDMVMLPYITAYDRNGSPSFRYFRERIFKNHRGFRFQGKVHEAVVPAGKIIYGDAEVTHVKEGQGDPDRNLRIYEQMEAKKESFDSRALYYYGRELICHKQYEKAIRILKQFLGRQDGWVENKIDAVRQIARGWYALGEDEKALAALLGAFAYDVPRGETCCALGQHFQERNCFEQAVYWYKQALSARKNDRGGAFVEEECYGFLPAISLCICYDRMGDKAQAEYYNELAAHYNPDAPCCHYNRVYFQKQKEKSHI